MSPPLNSEELSARINDAQSASPNIVEMGKNVSAIIASWPSDKGLYAQLQRLSAFIEQTKTEISALRPTEVKQSFLPTATDELDATVAATADATTRIMDAGDQLMELSGELSPEQADRVVSMVTSIFEACSFQDITGQRIKKVVKTLKVIEERIDQMLMSQGIPVSESDLISTTANQRQCGDNDLLNGPALPGQARTQAEIDALLGL